MQTVDKVCSCHCETSPQTGRGNPSLFYMAAGRTAALRCRGQEKQSRSFRSRAIGGTKRLSEAREWLCGKAFTDCTSLYEVRNVARSPRVGMLLAMT